MLVAAVQSIVSTGHKFTEGPAVNTKGEVFFNDMSAGKSFKVALDGKVGEFIADPKHARTGVTCMGRAHRADRQ